MTVQSRLSQIEGVIETLNDSSFRWSLALQEEIARDPDGTDPRFVIYTGQDNVPRVYRDFVQSRDRGNYFGYRLGTAWGVTNVYRFQSQRQAELVAAHVKNGAGDPGRVCTYRNALEESLKDNVQAVELFMKALERNAAKV